MNLIYRNWAKAGLLFAIVIIAYIYFYRKQNIALLDKYILLNLAFLMIHQFEEYVYPGTFKDYFNNNLYNPFGFFRNKLTDKGILWVNVVLGWGINILVLVFFSENTVLVTAAIAVIFINGVMHFAPAYKTRYYNPGLVTGAVLFVSFGLYSFNKFYTLGLINLYTSILAGVIAILCSLLIPLTIYLCRAKR
ncbi:MAG: HXXEE domain-containing protein [Ignavibacteria bacterium]|nr:HXXEE domain-containing protein [Ignavibacteria bacterium]